MHGWGGCSTAAPGVRGVESTHRAPRGQHWGRSSSGGRGGVGASVCDHGLASPRAGVSRLLDGDRCGQAHFPFPVPVFGFRAHGSCASRSTDRGHTESVRLKTGEQLGLAAIYLAALPPMQCTRGGCRAPGCRVQPILWSHAAGDSPCVAVRCAPAPRSMPRLASLKGKRQS